MRHSFAAPFETYIAPARAKREVWRVIAGVCLILLIYGGFAYGVLLLAERVDGRLISVGSSAGLFVFLATFIGMAAGPMIVVRILHDRSISSLFGRAAWVLRDFAIAVGGLAVIFTVFTALWSIWFDALPNMDFSAWVPLLPLALFLLLIQTGAEELVFRGYLQQQLAARFAHPVIWAVIPSVLFGLLHYDPETTGDNLWFIVVATGVFGLAAADLTARAGSLGAAWGFHFANNIVALLILSIDGPTTGLALFVTPYSADAAILRYLIFVDIATILVAWFVLRRILRR